MSRQAVSDRQRIAAMREVAEAAQPGDIAALWSSENDYRWLVRKAEPMLDAVEAVAAAEHELSVLHDLIHKTGTSLTELDAAVWRVHDILRPAIKRVASEGGPR